MDSHRLSDRVLREMDAARADALALAVDCIRARDYGALDHLRARLAREWTDGMADGLIRDAYQRAWGPAS